MRRETREKVQKVIERRYKRDSGINIKNTKENDTMDKDRVNSLSDRLNISAGSGK